MTRSAGEARGASASLERELTLVIRPKSSVAALGPERGRRCQRLPAWHALNFLERIHPRLVGLRGEEGWERVRPSRYTVWRLDILGTPCVTRLCSET